MNEHPPVSVYIVTYMNSEERGSILRATCESALAQRYPALEVVVSDNGGSYSAFDALASVADPRLKIYRHEENAGFTGNMNRCPELCRYDLIKPLCDDDLIHPDYLALTVPHVDEETLVVADVMKYQIGTSPDGIDEALYDPPETEQWASGYGHGIWSIRYSSSSLPSAAIFHRKLFTELGRYDHNTITSDWDFFIEACIHARTICLKHVLCYVGVWEGSLTEQMLEKPFFYPHESLYTKFRVLHCKGIGKANSIRLTLRLFKELFWQGLRPFKHFYRPHYWAGYARYLSHFFKLMFSPCNGFGERPKNP
jgi:glycosyltransferase involved in cell wall biosynthesis